MTQRYFGKFGELRIQSGPVSASSNHYFKVNFVNMNFTGPSGRGRPEEIAVLDRNQLISTTHFVQGSDEGVMAPVQITFTADMDDTFNRGKLRDAMGNPDRLSPWTVGGLSFANTNGKSKIRNGSGTLVSVPPPYDSQIDRVDVVVLWTGGTPGTNDEGRAYREVYFQPSQVQINESDRAVQMAITGMCYGAISAISAFSAGSAV